MTVTLPSVFESFVRQKIASGAYQSADEVVEDSLALLQHGEHWQKQVAAKIDDGLRDLEEGRVLSSEQSVVEMNAFKARWRAGA